MWFYKCRTASNIESRRDFTNFGLLQHCNETWFCKCRTVATLYRDVILQMSDCLQHWTETWFYKFRTACNIVPKRDFTNVGLFGTLPKRDLIDFGVFPTLDRNMISAKIVLSPTEGLEFRRAITKQSLAKIYQLVPITWMSVISSRGG